MALVFLRLLFKSTWFRYNRLLLFTFLFQFVVLIFRVVYMFSVGYQGKPKIAYFLVKQGGPADSILSLTAFLCYLELLMAKYDQIDDPEFNLIELKRQYNSFYFQTVISFAIYWAVLFAVSYQRGSLIEVELGCSLAMLILGILYWIAGGGLLLKIDKVTGADKEDAQFSGKTTALQLILLSVTQIFFRCVFWSVEDFAKLTYPDSHNSAIPYWRLMWFIQQTFEIIGSCVIFGSVAMIAKVETEVENSAENVSLPEHEEF